MSDRPTPETDAAEAKRRAEWLHKHKAHKDWIILSVSEVAVIRDELLILERERDEARAALRKAIRFVDAYEPHSRGAEEDQNETLSIIRKVLEGVK